MTVNHDIAGSSPAGGAKKSCTKVRDFFIHCGAMAYHRRRRISSRDSVYLITEGAFLLRNDDIQRQAVDDIQSQATDDIHALWRDVLRCHFKLQTQKSR